uniref:Uncharacterized protein n=1 Tax=Escherichia coli TaxID=562 RepID=A0A7U1E152_ECOLX|nr:hypothetical protein [Escherichia coli]QRG45005.1 hypothetical protein [Escherichia coli]
MFPPYYIFIIYCNHTEIRTRPSTDYLFSLLFFHATSPAVASKNIRP